MIVDCHTHLNFYEDETKNALPQCLDRLQKEMRRNRVDISLVLTSYTVNPGRPSTREVVEAIRDLKNIFVIAGVSYLNYKTGDLSEIKEYLQNGSVRGLKFYCGYEPFYPTDPHMLPAIELAEEFDVPLMVHAGDTYSAKGKLKYAHPIHIDELAVDHPHLKIIICHLGNPWIRDCMEIVYKNSNVYTDISGLSLGKFTDRFERYMCQQLQEMLLWGVEPENVLYGSDWPIASMETYINFIEQLKMPEQDRKKIMYKNAADLFRLELSDSQFNRGSLKSWIR